MKLGAALTTSQVELGQRVGVAWTRDVCNRCAMCMTELGETRCLEQIQSGRKVDGTFTQYTVVPYQYLMPLPELLTDEEIAPILCGGVTIYKALKICGATPGQWITIVGAGGGVGSLGIQYAKSMGFRVIAIDAGEDKRWYCMGLGAEAYMDATNTADIKYDMARITKGSAASASIAVAGSARAYQTSLDSLGPFGTLVCIGIPPPQDLVQIHPLQIIDMGIRIIGSAVGTRGDVLAALEFVKRRAVVPVVRKGSLQSLEEIATHFKEGKVRPNMILAKIVRFFLNLN